MRNFIKILLLLFIVWRIKNFTLPCDILISGLILYIKPFYRDGLLIDKGDYIHHFVYNGTVLNEPKTDIFFKNHTAYLDTNFPIAAFQFPSPYLITIDIEPLYTLQDSGDLNQIIFRKLKSGIFYITR